MISDWRKKPFLRLLSLGIHVLLSIQFTFFSGTSLSRSYQMFVHFSVSPKIHDVFICRFVCAFKDTSVTNLSRTNTSVTFGHSYPYHVYLGSTISDTFSLDVELDKCIGKAATMFSRLTKRVWLNKKLMTYTKIQVYRAYVLSTLLYCSESWTLCRII